MSIVTEQKRLAPTRLRLEVQVPADELDASIDSSARMMARELKLPGFRKGKVPPALVLQRLGREAVISQTLQDSLPIWYRDALTLENVEPIGEPKIDVAGLPQPGESLSFSVEVGVRPPAKLGKYKGLEVPRRRPEVPATAVEAELERIRHSMGRLEPVDRPLATGDYAVIDFVGTVDGEEFEGGTARDYSVEIGGQTLIEGFEDQLVGANAGEEREVEVSFPDQYKAEKLAGRRAVFSVKVKAVQEKHLPSLDDDLAAAATEFETLAELRADIENKLRQAQENVIEQEFRQAAVDAALAKAKIEIPTELIEARVRDMWDEAQGRLAQRGISAEAYLKVVGKSEDELLNELKQDAEQAIGRESVLEAVVAKEAIEIGDDELRAALADQTRPGGDQDDLLEKIVSSGTDRLLRREMRAKKAADLVAAAAKPIPVEQAKAREQIWTPQKQERESRPKAELWTPS